MNVLYPMCVVETPHRTIAFEQVLAGTTIAEIYILDTNVSVWNANYAVLDCFLNQMHHMTLTMCLCDGLKSSVKALAHKFLHENVTFNHLAPVIDFCLKNTFKIELSN